MIGRLRRYGLDQPPLVTGLLGGALASLAGAGVAAWAGVWPLAVPLLVAGGYLTGSGGTALHTMLRGKFVVWAELLDQLPLTGGERVLDAGCGSGAVAVAAARRLPRGQVVGLDLWRRRNQSGNTPARTLRNAAEAGAAGRLRVLTGDLRRLPFRDGAFDLVLSAMAVQKIPDPAGRAQAVAELLRVLRPGGRLLIVDVTHPLAYAELTRPAAARQSLRRLGWRYSCGTPWLVSWLLDAEKPGRQARVR